MSAFKTLKKAGQTFPAESRPLVSRCRLGLPGRRRDAPTFLVRLVGKSCARHLIRDEMIEPHHD